jgi:hypothetical protein
MINKENVDVFFWWPYSQMSTTFFLVHPKLRLNFFLFLLLQIKQLIYNCYFQTFSFLDSLHYVVHISTQNYNKQILQAAPDTLYKSAKLLIFSKTKD